MQASILWNSAYYINPKDRKGHWNVGRLRSRWQGHVFKRRKIGMDLQHTHPWAPEEKTRKPKRRFQRTFMSSIRIVFNLFTSAIPTPYRRMADKLWMMIWDGHGRNWLWSTFVFQLLEMDSAPHSNFVKIPKCTVQSPWKANSCSDIKLPAFFGGGGKRRHTALFTTAHYWSLF